MSDFEVKKTYPTLYKRGSKGEVRAWYMEFGTMHENVVGAHRVVSGVDGGKMTASAWKVATAKNISKVNETTSLQQAEIEIKARYDIQKEKGYFEDVDQIDKVLFTKPMLATDWSKRKSKVDISKGVYIQPKLDGIRCIARKDGLWTRTGKPIKTCPHIVEELKPVFAVHPDLVLDGELYNHDFKDRFNELVSLIRKEKPTREQAEETAEFVEYHVYDVPSHKGIFSDRMIFLSITLSNVVKNRIVKMVETLYENDEGNLDRTFGDWIAQGYEGQMIRMNTLYENKRSNQLMKRKDFITEEFPVLQMNEGQGNWSGYAKTLTVKLETEAKSVPATCRGSQKVLKELWESGKTPEWATVQYFGYTPDGSLRFPTVVDYGYGERDY